MPRKRLNRRWAPFGALLMVVLGCQPPKPEPIQGPQRSEKHMDQGKQGGEWPPDVVEKVTRDRAARDAVRQHHPALFAAVSEAMFRHDPIGINFGDNTDEYDAVAGTVIPRLTGCSSAADVELVLHEEFVRWFGADTAGDRARYTALSVEVWRLWSARQAEPGAAPDGPQSRPAGERWRSAAEGGVIRAGVLIWVDWIAGAVVGVLVLSLRGWLAQLYSLPADLLLMMGLANLAYACVSFTLAMFSRGDRVPLLRVVAVANVVWAVICTVLAVVWFSEGSVFGVGSLVGEGLFVGGLGVLEWLAAGRRGGGHVKPGAAADGGAR